MAADAADAKPRVLILGGAVGQLCASWALGPTR